MFKLLKPCTFARVQRVTATWGVQRVPLQDASWRAATCRLDACLFSSEAPSEVTLATVMEKVSSLNNPIIFINMLNVKVIGEYLFQKNFSTDDVVKLFTANPDLCTYSKQNWEGVVDFLVGNEIRKKSILQALTKVPQILDKTALELEDSFNCLRSRGLENKKICQLIANAPELFVVDPLLVDKQFTKLMTVFTKKDIIKMVPYCWGILTQEWSELEEKLRYIIHDMGIEQPQIVHSMALAYSLRHIRLRHQYVYRTGVYKKVRPKKKVSNMRLSDITDTSTRELVEKIVGTSMQDFFSFEKLLDQEILESNEQSDDSDIEPDQEY